jgi:hypothetical protein
VGGTALEHLVVAFHFEALTLPATIEFAPGVRLRRDAELMAAGILLDYFPDPTGGWHFPAMVASSTVDLPSSERFETTNVGTLLGLGVGYDAWVSPLWSLGLSARIGRVLRARDEYGRYDAWLPSLAVSALLH